MLEITDSMFRKTTRGNFVIQNTMFPPPITAVDVQELLKKSFSRAKKTKYGISLPWSCLHQAVNLVNAINLAVDKYNKGEFSHHCMLVIINSMVAATERGVCCPYTVLHKSFQFKDSLSVRRYCCFNGVLVDDKDFIYQAQQQGIVIKHIKSDDTPDYYVVIDKRELQNQTVRLGAR